MSAVEHDHARLGAYVLGGLDAAEARGFEAHLASCAECRHEVEDLSPVRDALEEIPPEAFLEGRPEGRDLVLRRALRRVRDEAASRRSRLPAMTGVAALIVVALGAGVLVGRRTAPDTTAQPAPPTASSPVAPSGVRRIEATDASTGVHLDMSITPAVGWVRLHVVLQGLQEGEKCKLLVIPKQGQPVEAGSWVVPGNGERPGAGLDGSALVPLDDVVSVEVVTLDGRKLVSASV
jgi:anti-sigma-K factor RskA